MKFLRNLFKSLFQTENLLTANSGDPDFEKEKIEFLQAVRLIHSSELQQFRKLEKYNEQVGVTYYEYLIAQQHISELKNKFSHVFELDKKITEINTDVPIVYKSFDVKIKSSLFKIFRKIDLGDRLYDKTVIKVSEGITEVGKLIVRSKWSNFIVHVDYLCPSYILHAAKIKALQQQFALLKDNEIAAFKEVSETKFIHPVLFISHRWESTEHPDPNNEQLKKLQVLENCFAIYDFCSFPQKPYQNNDAEKLHCILKHMSRLIQNVVILQSNDYFNRGWCIYEYLTSSLLGSVICDEIQDDNFVALRNWVATRVPFPTNLFRDSWESQQQNYINDQILSGVNSILPQFKNSGFTVEEDRSIVIALLLAMLKKQLPAKKEHQQNLGEWKTVQWTEDELMGAFEHELKWEKEISLSRPAFDMDVPKTIEEAMRRNFEIKKDSIYKRSLY